MGARWQAKYGRKIIVGDATQSERWLKKYGPKFGIVADYDPNQPRDDRGRWSRIGGATGSRMTIAEMEARYDKLIDKPISRTTPEEDNELSIISSRLGVKNMRETFEAPVVITVDKQPIKSDADLERLGISKEMIGEARDEAIRLEEKYGEPVEINFTDPPPGANFSGWVYAGNESGTGALVININKNSYSKYALERDERSFNSEIEKFGEAGNRRLHFGVKKHAGPLGQEGLDLPKFLQANPDYANAVRFTVKGNPPTGSPSAFLRTVLRHEYAHVVHLSAGMTRKKEIDRVVNIVSPSRRWLISDYAATSNNETWAEAFTMYENHPALAEKVLPGPLINYIKKLHGG